MVWVTVDKDGNECIFEEEPYKDDDFLWSANYNKHGECSQYVYIPNGTIEKILGYKLTWEDEQFKFKLRII